MENPVPRVRQIDKIHPTRRNLIDTFVLLAGDTDFDKITVDTVLEKSGVSKGSLYHHFKDFDDLLAQALSCAFSVGVNRSIGLIKAMIIEVQTPRDFESFLRKIILDTLTPEGVRQRIIRARIIGESKANPQLQISIGQEQNRLTAEIEEVLRHAQRKSIVKQGLNLRIAAVFIQVYTFGKIIDDLSETPVDQEEWSDWIAALLAIKIIV